MVPLESELVQTPLTAGAVDGCTSWSEWKDRDDPSFKSDTETIAGFEIDGLPADLCLQPSAAQGRIKATKQMVTAQNVLMGLNGLDCVNNQNDLQCLDYEVRFCCPGNIHPIEICASI